MAPGAAGPGGRRLKAASVCLMSANEAGRRGTTRDLEERIHEENCKLVRRAESSIPVGFTDEFRTQLAAESYGNGQPPEQLLILLTAMFAGSF